MEVGVHVAIGIALARAVRAGSVTRCPARQPLPLYYSLSLGRGKGKDFVRSSCKANNSARSIPPAAFGKVQCLEEILLTVNQNIAGSGPHALRTQLFVPLEQY